MQKMRLRYEIKSKALSREDSEKLATTESEITKVKQQLIKLARGEWDQAVRVVSGPTGIPMMLSRIPMPMRTSEVNPMKKSSEQTRQTKLRQIFTTRFDESELRTFCFDILIDYDSLSGEGKEAKARELVAYCERRRCIPELVERGKESRPDISWDDIYDPTKEQVRPEHPYDERIDSTTERESLLERRRNWRLLKMALEDKKAELGRDFSAEDRAALLRVREDLHQIEKELHSLKK